MNTREDKTAQATYIAGAGKSTWILGLVYPIKSERIVSTFDRPHNTQADTRQTSAPQTQQARSTGHFPTIAYDDGGWGE